jgi:hypothetical protein
MPNKHVLAAAEGLPKIADFPLPAMNQGPANDLEIIKAHLNVIARVFEDGSVDGLASSEVSDLLTVISGAIEMFEPILLFLDEVPDKIETYRKCRRFAITNNVRAAS